METLIMIAFWPVCCILTMLISVPLVAKIQKKHPNYDGRLLALTTLLSVSSTLAWLQWGQGEEATKA